MTISEAIAEFQDAANSKADDIVSARKDHQLHATMTKAYTNLVLRGPEGESAFATQLRTILHMSAAG